MSDDHDNATRDDATPLNADDLAIAAAVGRLSDEFDRASAVFVARVLSSVDWRGMLNEGIADALQTDQVLKAVSRMTAAAPDNLSVNALIQRMSELLATELETRLLGRFDRYLRAIPVARAAATRAGPDENQAVEDGDA